MLPHPLIVRTYIARGIRLWLAIRGIVTCIILLGASSQRLSLPAMIQLVGVSVALCFLETHRRRERALLGNLGVPPFTLAVLFALPAVLGEIAIRALVA